MVLYTLGFEGHYSEAGNLIATLMSEVERLEPRNPSLLLRMAQLFSRVAGGKMPIVQQTKVLVEKALGLARTAEGLSELGRHLRMLEQPRLALKAYKDALELETSSPDPMIGLGCRDCTIPLTAIIFTSPIRKTPSSSWTSPPTRRVFLRHRPMPPG